MINTALDFLKQELEEYLEIVNSGISTGDGFIVLSNVADQDGKWAIPADKMGMSLINVEEERVFKDQKYLHKNDQGDVERYNPNIKLNLYVLFCANYVNKTGDTSNYMEGLKQLSNVVSFFQGKYVFTPDNSPGMEPNLKKLIVDLYSYTFEQQYNFWSILGTKYLPSVLYKVRLVTYQEKLVQTQNSPIYETDFLNNSNT